MNTKTTSAVNLLNNYINNTTNILLDDEERNGWELHVNNLNFLTNWCKGTVYLNEVEQFLSNGILPLLIDVKELESVHTLLVTASKNIEYPIKIQLSWL
jgi:hypothetical protein